MVEAKVLSVGELLELMQKQQEATALLLVRAVQQLLMQERMDMANLLPGIAQDGGVYGLAAIAYVVKGLMLNKAPTSIADDAEERLLDEQITLPAEVVERLTDPYVILAIITEILTSPGDLVANGNGDAEAGTMTPSLAALLRAIHTPDTTNVIPSKTVEEITASPEEAERVATWLLAQPTGTMADDTKLIALTPVIEIFTQPVGTVRGVVSKWLAARGLPLFVKEDLPFEEREKFTKVKKLIRVEDARALLLEATAEGKTRI